ncbi:tetratricopeptide repeat protein [Streptomyces sp. ME02-6978a]|uniref:tetratricopeptide repeat protein n=1 Tax=unclassified Streptomyces TaxID=2593676 RepID=UPI0029BC556D|nr:MULTISPECIES: tetratricopeptide repeat protein [unclassified Streptomyces]MDX3091172.1 tetratricopeptide repeat protein [Streptomyces sp. ME12-02E]MDX3334175.1 tetratricopeptide repeat protein [Streptomyces sp. ME02-6978a]
MNDPTSQVMDFDTLRRAMADNYEQPEGPARNARAETLLAEAEKLGIPLALIEALGHQLKVYNYSSEKDKMFVPFARLLRMWDEHPEDFDEYETHTLHWVFKWMTAGMLGQPHIPLASVEKWLGEMEHRYRLAGHSERAVRHCEFSVASHIGDEARAERAFTAWLAADRDAMADCHACELHDQGWWQAWRENDEEALSLWAPVLDGTHACAHEPHAVLASSLLPLLRLGRVDEARAHHLRGLRLVRPMESMRGSYADHVEFCALTGNEARGLELLAERPAYFTDTGEPRSHMDFLAVVALLTDRLVALGHGGRTVPGPAGRDWTAEDLARHARAEALALAERFDARNGTPHIGRHVRARMDRRPLLDRLPLGVRAPRPAHPVPAPRPAEARPADTPRAEPDLADLLAEARRTSEAMHPDSLRAWAAAARAAEGRELPARDRAEIADHEAMGSGPEGAGLFERAADLYEEAGEKGEALAARARAAFVRALTTGGEEPPATVEELRRTVLALHAEGGTGAWEVASVLVCRVRVLTHLALADHAPHEHDHTGGAGDPEHPDGPADAEEALRAAREAAEELLEFTGPHTAQPRLASRAAEARATLGELAAHAGDLEAAGALLTRAVEEYLAAGQPWFAVDHETRLAALARALGDTEAAERAVRAALEHGAGHLDALGQAQSRLRLAEILGEKGEFPEAAEHALEAAHWADEAGEARTLGAWARHLLGGFLLRRGRAAEAAEVLESALPDLDAGTHGDGAVVQTLWWLGDCHTELGEHRQAAERWLRAAETARHWPEQRDHAMLAHLAAEALGRAGLPEEAERAYVRAAELWRTEGNPHGVVRALRARAWLAADGEGADGGPARARDLMDEALRVCREAAAAADDEDGARERLIAERGHTHRQFGDLLARTGDPDDAGDPVLEEALGHLDEAVAVYASLGEDAADMRTGAELAAAWLELDLGRREAAGARAGRVLAVYGETAPEDAAPGPASHRRAEARRIRELAERTEA